MNFRIGWGGFTTAPVFRHVPFSDGTIRLFPPPCFIPGGGDNSKGDDYASRSLASI